MVRRIALLVLLTLTAIVLWQWVTFPDVARLANKPPATTSFMDLRRAELREAGHSDALSYQFVPYERISPYLRRAVLVAEDDAFYEHEGVDVKGIAEAVRKDWQRKRITHGGSTITQQLAKNLYLSPSRNPYRKVKEYFLARSMESHLTKKRILELYLNVVEMGERVYGAEAASRAYFGKAASSLTPQQAALLAGCLPNPRFMKVLAPNKRLRWRQRMILSRMRRWGYLLEKEVLTARTPSPESEPAHSRQEATPPSSPASKSAGPETAPSTETLMPGDPPASETTPPATSTTIPPASR